LALFDSFNGQLKTIRTMDFQTQIAHNSSTDTLEPRSELEIQYELERNKPLPSLNHARVQSRLTFELDNSYNAEYDILPELDIQFPNKLVVPDISIYPKSTTDWDNDVLTMVDLPLLVIEILSFRQIFNDITDRIRKVYFPAGLKSTWVVLPSIQSIMIFKPNAKPKLYNSGIMQDEASGFKIDLDKIF
jgi:Uma2 family endonuclease